MENFIENIIAPSETPDSSSTCSETKRGMLVVVNERPPFQGAAILKALETYMVEESDRAVCLMDYEEIVLMALSISDDDPARFQRNLIRFEYLIFDGLKRRIQDGHLVILSGWIRKGPLGKDLLSNYLSIVRGTECLVLWFNLTDDDPDIFEQEYLTATTEDVRWAEDNNISISLSLIEPFQEPLGTLADVRLKFFSRAVGLGPDLDVDELCRLTNYWDTREG
jgi:hypothetical protein